MQNGLPRSIGQTSRFQACQNLAAKKLPTTPWLNPFLWGEKWLLCCQIKLTRSNSKPTKWEVEQQKNQKIPSVEHSERRLAFLNLKPSMKRKNDTWVCLDQLELVRSTINLVAELTAQSQWDVMAPNVGRISIIDWIKAAPVFFVFSIFKSPSSGSCFYCFAFQLAFSWLAVCSGL